MTAPSDEDLRRWRERHVEYGELLDTEPAFVAALLDEVDRLRAEVERRDVEIRALNLAAESFRRWEARARAAMERAVPYTAEGYPGGEVCALLRAVLEEKP